MSKPPNRQQGNKSYSAAFIDGAGCAGFKIGQGSTHCLTVALVLLNSQQPLRRKLDEYRTFLHWHERREFHFNDVSDEIRTEFFRRIAPLRFDVRALIVDKGPPMKPMTANDLYNAVTEAVLDYAGDCLQDTLVVIDEPTQNKKKQADLRRFLRKALNANRQRLRIRDVKLPASHTNSLVQVADMICGAINRKYESERKCLREGRGKMDDRFYNLIAGHITDECLWGVGSKKGCPSP